MLDAYDFIKLKEIPTELFFCKFCKILQNTLFLQNTSGGYFCYFHLCFQSEHVSKLIKVPGIIISASAIRVKATRISIQCRGCKNTIPNIGIKPGLEGYAMPRSCPTDQTSKPAPCPLDPFFILPDKCQCVDFQVKLILSPEISKDIQVILKVVQGSQRREKTMGSLIQYVSKIFRKTNVSYALIGTCACAYR